VYSKFYHSAAGTEEEEGTAGDKGAASVPAPSVGATGGGSVGGKGARLSRKSSVQTGEWEVTAGKG